MHSLALVPDNDESDSGDPRATDHEPWSSVDWQTLWLSIQRQRWRTLALVPASANVPLDLTLDAAVALARTGTAHYGTQIHVADATQVGFADMGEFIEQLRDTIDSGPVILALGPASSSPVTVQLAQSADFSLLCVVLKSMRVSEANQTVADIGRQHFLGAITFQ
jgi:hypothetical protein